MCSVASHLSPPQCCLPDILELIFLPSPVSLECEDTVFLQKRTQAAIEQLVPRNSCVRPQVVDQLITELGNMNQFFMLNVSWNSNPIQAMGPGKIITKSEQDALGIMSKTVKPEENVSFLSINLILSLRF